MNTNINLGIIGVPAMHDCKCECIEMGHCPFDVCKDNTVNCSRCLRGIAAHDAVRKAELISELAELTNKNKLSEEEEDRLSLLQCTAYEAHNNSETRFYRLISAIDSEIIEALVQKVSSCAKGVWLWENGDQRVWNMHEHKASNRTLDPKIRNAHQKVADKLAKKAANRMEAIVRRYLHNFLVTAITRDQYEWKTWDEGLMAMYLDEGLKLMLETLYCNCSVHFCYEINEECKAVVHMYSKAREWVKAQELYDSVTIPV